jgi:beta-glucosidase
VVSKAFGDRIKNWMTLNEPWCSAFLGYGIGVHAPGIKDIGASVQAAHHLLLAHGKAVPAIRANTDANTRVGIVLNPSWVDAATDSPEDKAAAHRADGFQNRWYLDPLYKGEYPADILELYGPFAPKMEAGDTQAMAAPTDFLGINYYARSVVGAGDGENPLDVRFVRPEGDYTAMDWEIYPRGFYNLIMRIHRDYAPATIYITENGAAFDDPVAEDGKVHDADRQKFLEGYISEVSHAIEDGAPVKGYFVWSLMDNFEWAYGYSKRFGIIHVDYDTLKRTFKQSADWYSKVTRENGYVMP